MKTKLLYILGFLISGAATGAILWAHGLVTVGVTPKAEAKHVVCLTCGHVIKADYAKPVEICYDQDSPPRRTNYFCEAHAKKYDRETYLPGGDTIFWKHQKPWRRVQYNGADFEETREVNPTNRFVILFYGNPALTNIQVK